jgi:AcrR family transcriptional regulator
VAAARRSTRTREVDSPPSTDRDGRERILRVAIRSFSEAGYEGTTTAGVARAAGVTQPLVHHHFGSKEGLWRAAMDELFAEVPSIPSATGGSPAEQLRAGFERFVRFIAARPEITRVIAREGAAASPRLTYLVDRYLRAPFRQVVATLEAGQRAGVVARDLRPDLLLFFLLGAGSHLFDVTALARETLGTETSSPRTREDFVRVLLEVLQGGILRAEPRKRARRA